jgi:ABC-type lipoprotein release transport system permease subunit
VERENATNSSDPVLFFNGDSFLLRRVCGVDFDVESSVFSKLLFPSGGFSGMKGSSGILISKQVADRFGSRVGDSVTLRVVNRQGYLDSAELVVKGIFKDASIFGYYTAYMDRETLRKLLGDPKNSCSAMGFYFSGAENSQATAKALQAALKGAGLELFPALHNRTDLEALGAASWLGVRYAVLPVEDYIDAKVMDLIHAIQLVSYLFLGMILIIILVGMRNTTKIMTRRRTKEIGTIRALGMPEGGAIRLILGESLIIASSGFVIGVLGAMGLLFILQAIPFSWSDGFDIFLRQGHLSWQLSPFFLSVNYAALVVMTLIGSLPSARRAAHISPASAIASNE